MSGLTQRLTITEAQAKVTECRSIAKRAINPEHAIMLEHMAETWERIVADMIHHQDH